MDILLNNRDLLVIQCALDEIIHDQKDHSLSTFAKSALKKFSSVSTAPPNLTPPEVQAVVSGLYLFRSSREEFLDEISLDDIDRPGVLETLRIANRLLRLFRSESQS